MSKHRVESRTGHLCPGERTGEASKILRREVYTDLTNKGWSGGGLTHAQEESLDDHDEALRELVRELPNRIETQSQAPSQSCIDAGGCDPCSRGLELLARAKAVAP